MQPEQHDLYSKSIVVDGLIISKWGEDIFRAMSEAGLTAAVSGFPAIHRPRGVRRGYSKRQRDG